MIPSDTFTLGETTNHNKRLTPVPVHYCSYCGAIAMCDTRVGDRSEYYEEYHTFYCSCPNAASEISMAMDLWEAKQKVHQLERKLEDMKKLTNNQIVNRIKYENEVRKLRAKFGMGEDR